MYNLFYCAGGHKLNATFSSYEACSKALSKLKESYPNAKMWMQRVDVINSVDEWEFRRKNIIQEYSNF